MKHDLREAVISAHQYFALPLSIIAGDKNLCPWVYSEFMQLYSYREHEEEYTHFSVYNNRNERFLYEPLNGTVIRPHKLATGGEIISLLKTLLNNGFYIYDFVDHYYLKIFGYTGHYIHDLLVFGYDDEQGVLHVYGYFMGKLQQFLIPYSDYQNAYESEYHKGREHLTVLYTKKKKVHNHDVADSSTAGEPQGSIENPVFSWSLKKPQKLKSAVFSCTFIQAKN